MSRKTGASLNRGRSKQDIGTPSEFIEAAEARFGKIELDLAANDDNCVVASHWGPGSKISDSLGEDWSRLEGTLWLNPPFGNIGKWAKKCAGVRDRPGWTLMLVPAAVGSNWFQEYVVPNAHVLELRDRIKFVGSNDPYPKDLILCCFVFGVIGRNSWHWNSQVRKRVEP